MYTIKFNFEEKGLEPVVIQNVGPWESILEIALKNDIDLHHNCGGVCAWQHLSCICGKRGTVY